MYLFHSRIEVGQPSFGMIRFRRQKQDNTPLEYFVKGALNSLRQAKNILRTSAVCIQRRNDIFWVIANGGE